MGQVIVVVVIIMAIIGVLMSMLLLLKNEPIRGKKVSLRNFVVLILVYLTMILAFGCLYMALEMLGWSVLTEDKRKVGGSVLHLIEDTLYFSAVTLLSVGYGDITPLGIGRPIAMMQALIGYVLPAAFVVTTVIYDRRTQ
ncbi:potassium channel family protein [Bacillus alkalicellulosilyticus]|uniref:potassium channel family protein n=1 Tax=Alkalihalobacterium alkalicellulosilyticum TaxID=1912214 RepID=UPI00099688CF|nr:potassium channel family protein [Bacillus alkalicellulosilyticus]